MTDSILMVRKSEKFKYLRIFFLYKMNFWSERGFSTMKRNMTKTVSDNVKFTTAPTANRNRENELWKNRETVKKRFLPLPVGYRSGNRFNTGLVQTTCSNCLSFLILFFCFLTAKNKVYT